MIELVHEAQYAVAFDDSVVFSFCYDLDYDGLSCLGDGSDEEPFFLGMTAKRIFSNADRDADSFVFHMDPTFKLSTCGYPVFVCGISGIQR
jgi:hypothetical protein